MLEKVATFKESGYCIVSIY